MGNNKEKFYPETNFGGFSDVDGTIAFYSHVNALIQPDSVLLDIGCGRGAWLDDPVHFRRNLRMLKGKCKRVIGMDVNPEARSNPAVDEFQLLETNTWPLEEASIDVCICDYVLEHVQDPAGFFKECRRVLKPGGFLCIRTTNLLSYFGLFAKVIPNRSHTRILRQAKEKLHDKDVFPTFFRCNTVKTLRRYLSMHHFESTVYGYEAEPGYLSFSILAYYLGVLHQKHAPRSCRVGIHAFAQKRSSSSG